MYASLLILALLYLCTAIPSPQRFSIHDDTYVPKHWKLIPRTKNVAPRPPPLNLKPDDYYRFIPTYVGSVLPGKPLSWSAPCFKENTATLTLDGNSSAKMVLDMGAKSSLFCDDGYLFGYIGSFDFVYYELPGLPISWSGPFTDDELFDIQHSGIRIFKLPDGAVFTAEEFFETIMLFFGGLIGAYVPDWTAEDNLQFLQDHMGVTMPVRNITRVDLPQNSIQSGDFLGIIRLDGLDPMMAWGMGSHTGHTAICLWVDGELNVVESTTNSAYWPTNGIQITPWDKWLQQAQDADYNVVHLPLDPAVAKEFDAVKAYAYFKTVEGLPYGFHNLFTGWVDTAEDNYPPPLSSYLVQLLALFGEWLLQNEFNAGETYDFLRQGLNKRLGTNGLTIGQAYMEAQKRGINFTQLITMPEQDSWIFDDDGSMKGPSMVCDVLVMSMWKAGGIFGSLGDSIMATEFTNWDAYSLNIFDANYKRPQACVTADPDSRFCQLLGKYRMDLPGYNTFKPFAHMRERCPGLPPDYKKPADC